MRVRASTRPAALLTLATAALLLQSHAAYSYASDVGDLAGIDSTSTAGRRVLLQSSQLQAVAAQSGATLSVCTSPYNPFVRPVDREADMTGRFGVPMPAEEFFRDFEGHDVELLAALVEMAYPLELGNAVTVTVHATFPTALYATRVGACDMSIGGYVRTTKREKCECPELPPGNGIGAASENEVCCLDFSTYYLRAGYSLLSYQSFHTKTITDYLDTYKDLITILCVLVLMLLISGHIIWFLERHRNTEQFPVDYVDGVDDGLWWSVTTMTTVGYGDKAPVTMWGRFVGVIWMFMGLWIFSMFSGMVAASSLSNAKMITFTDLDALVKRGLDVCTVGGDYQRFVAQSNIPAEENGVRGDGSTVLTRRTLTECYELMQKRNNATILYDRFALMADAMADDTSDQTPAFNSLLDNSGDGLVVSAVLETTHYGLAFPEDSTVLPILTPHLSALISDGALVFSDLSKRMKMGWSMDIGHRRWITTEGGRDEDYIIGHTTDSTFGDYSTMASLLIITAVVYTVYLAVQLGVLPAFLKRRERKRIATMDDEEGTSSLVPADKESHAASGRGGLLPPLEAPGSPSKAGSDMAELRAEMKTMSQELRQLKDALYKKKTGSNHGA